MVIYLTTNSSSTNKNSNLAAKKHGKTGLEQSPKQMHWLDNVENIIVHCHVAYGTRQKQHGFPEDDRTGIRRLHQIQ